MYKKLLEVQKKIGAIHKDSTNPFFKSHYFDINALLEAVKPVLSEQGLVLLQPLTNINGASAIKTILMDTETGESLEFETPLTQNPDPQKMGSAITYFRRYSLQSLLGLQAQDDDGNKASGKKPEKKVDEPERKKATSKKFIPEKSKDVARNRIQKGFDLLNFSQKNQDVWIEKALGCNLYDAPIDKLNILLERIEKQAKGDGK